MCVVELSSVERSLICAKSECRARARQAGWLASLYGGAHRAVDDFLSQIGFSFQLTVKSIGLNDKEKSFKKRNLINKLY